MKILGIDPGNTIGACLYDTEAKRVLFAGQYATPSEVLEVVHGTREWGGTIDKIAIERPRVYQMGGKDMANTIEQCGWLIAKLDSYLPARGPDWVSDCGNNVWAVERKAVIQALTEAVGQTVKGDPGVWAAMCRLHPDADRRPVAGVPGRPAEPPRLRAGSKTKWTQGKPAVEAIEAIPAGPLFGVSSHARAALAVAWTLGKHLGAA